MIEHNTLTHFLHKMTISTGKGSIVGFDFSDVDVILYEQKKPLLKTLLEEFQKNKILMILQNVDSNQIFLYFPKNDDIQSLLIKVQFMFGMALANRKEQAFYHIYHLNNKEEVEDLLHLLEHNQASTHVSSFKSMLRKESLTRKNEESLTPLKLTDLEKTLIQTDLSSLMRRQSVCIITGTGRPVELFDEIYVSLSDLQKALCPNVVLMGTPYLTDKLLEVLDKRVLDNVSHHDGGAFCKNFSLNMMVSTLLGPDFERFNAGLDAPFKSTVLLELSLSDILSNASLFSAAKEFVTNEGYQLCIDSVTAELLPFVSSKKLGVSFVKLQWNENLYGKLNDTAFADAIKEVGPQNIILNHVDDPKAIEWGQKLGINLFQGFYVQKMLYQAPRQKKTA